MMRQTWTSSHWPQRVRSCRLRERMSQALPEKIVVAWPGLGWLVRGAAMDPVTIGAVLAAVAGGAGGAFGSQLWAGVSALVRRPFRRDRTAGDTAALVSGGEAELAALEQAPADERRAVALAEVLVARADADGGFREALQAWWEQCGMTSEEPAGTGNTISGGQFGLVLQGRDIQATFNLPGAVSVGPEETQRRWPHPNFDLPRSPEQWFVGRDRELAMCREKLSASGFLIIHGLDGMGKTTLAQVYAANYQDDYDLIWLVPASQESSVSTKLELLASALDIVHASEPDAGLLRYALRRKLEEWNRWLLIFDDVRDWKSIQDYTIPSLRGHIVATTQDTPGVQDMRDDLMPSYLPLGSLPPAASKKYLMDHIEGASDADAERLAHDLGNLPFALKFAARKYAARSIPETDGTVKVASHELHILWQDTFDRLQTKSPLAHSLLEFCSLLASDPIPEKILTLHPRGNEPLGDLREALSTSKYSDLVEILRERSLLEAQPGSRAITFHSLLQADLRENIAPDRRRDLLSVAIDLLLDAFYESWFADNFSRCALALPHAEACLAISERYKIALAQASGLMTQIAHYHRTRGEIFKAHAFHERALQAREKAFGVDSIQVARSLNDLGIVLTEIGKPGEAIKKLERALKIEMSVESPDEEFIAIGRDNLGIAWAASGQYAQAIELHKLAYSFWKTRNPRHSGVAHALDNMGYALYLLGDLSQAEKVLRRAVEIGREALGTGFDELALPGLRPSPTRRAGAGWGG